MRKDDTHSIHTFVNSDAGASAAAELNDDDDDAVCLSLLRPFSDDQAMHADEDFNSQELPSFARP
eukprot:2997214-Karenia_brevis.AAC.1